MERFRKLSKVFTNSTLPSSTVDTYNGTKPIYRGTKPLTVADIHSHSPIDAGKSRYYCDELGTRRTQHVSRLPHPEDQQIDDILDSFPAPPRLMPVITDNGRTLYFPGDDLYYRDDELLPPPPPKVFEMIRQRERTRTHEARLEQQRIIQPDTPVENCDPRRPLYATSHSNMSTRSLGANARLKGDPVPKRAGVQQVKFDGSDAHRARPATAPHMPTVDGERQKLYSTPTRSLGASTKLKRNPSPLRAGVQDATIRGPSAPSDPQRARPATAPYRPSPRPDGERQKLYKRLFQMPEGERKRLRSVPTPVSPTELSVAQKGLHQAHPCASQGRSHR
ncbi:hypothetical protein C8R43DRAFT_956643 [Mycena crocata]|nr:hypothetical protein C8R43DRAFT_956643 [Mycena crocata]